MEPTQSPEISTDVPHIIEYGHAEPLRNRFGQWLPRLRFRSRLLILASLILVVAFVHEVPVWQGRELAPQRLGGFGSDGQALALLPGDRQLVRFNGTGVELLDLQTATRTFFSNGHAIRNTLSKAGRRLMSVDGNDVLRLYDLANLKRLAEIQLAQQGYGQHEASISDDGTRLVVWTHDASLWDANTGKEIKALAPHSSLDQEISDVQITADQRLYVPNRD